MKTISIIAALAVAAAILAPTVASAGGNSANTPGHNKEILAIIYDGVGSPTPGGEVKNLGGAISGGFYGNTSNAGVSPYAPENGHGVTPSISPGPSTVQGTFCSVGDFMHSRC